MILSALQKYLSLRKLEEPKNETILESAYQSQVCVPVFGIVHQTSIEKWYHFEIVECYEVYWCGEQGLKTLNSAIFKTMVFHITLVWNWKLAIFLILILLSGDVSFFALSNLNQYPW